MLPEFVVTRLKEIASGIEDSDSEDDDDMVCDDRQGISSSITVLRECISYGGGLTDDSSFSLGFQITAVVVCPQFELLQTSFLFTSISFSRLVRGVLS